MSRTGAPSGFSDASLTAFMAVEMFFTSGTVRLWNGIGDLTFDSNTYSGTGQLLSISNIEEAAEIGAKGITLGLSGINSTILSYALNENYQYKNIKIHVGTIDGATVDSYQIFSGRMDVMTIDENGETCNITLSAENRLIDLERPRVRRYTSEDQKSLHPNDKGFDFVNSLQEAEIKWGG